MVRSAAWALPTVAWNLGAVADDPGVGPASFDIGGRVGRDSLEIEVVKHLAIALAAVQDGAPGEAGLGAFQGEQFEEGEVVVEGDTPLPVMVGLHQRVIAGPGTAGQGHAGSLQVAGVAHQVDRAVPVVGCFG